MAAREPEVMSLRMRHLASAYIAPRVRPAVTAAAVVTEIVSWVMLNDGEVVLTRHAELVVSSMSSSRVKGVAGGKMSGSSSSESLRMD